jgi:hypothetical protein
MTGSCPSPPSQESGERKSETKRMSRCVLETGAVSGTASTRAERTIVSQGGSENPRGVGHEY